jgi:uncharacterized protein with PIN domain/sulfur carrier protein ThiS
MKEARFVFDQGLQDLLPREKRSRGFPYPFNGPQTVKHLIESLGIPHTEIGALSANGKSIGADYLVHDGDQIEVTEEALSESDLEPRFVIDGHLGRLAAHLRMLGLDCLYHSDYDDAELVKIAIEENRILLSRDRRLLMHKVIRRGYLLRSLEPVEQLTEVVRRFGLKKWVKPFQRCLRCNHPLEAVRKDEVLDRLEPLTKLYFEEFKICPNCEQVYWKGSHYERMMNIITRL